MRGVLTAQLLRLEAPRAVATCSRAWVSLSYRRLGPGRQSAGISTTCPAHKRPRLLTHARASLEDGADSSTVAIGQVRARWSAQGARPAPPAAVGLCALAVEGRFCSLAAVPCSESSPCRRSWLPRPTLCGSRWMR